MSIHATTFVPVRYGSNSRAVTATATATDFRTYTEYLLGHSVWNCSPLNATEPHWWYVMTGSGNGLMPSGSKPLPEPLLTKIYVALCHRNRDETVFTTTEMKANSYGIFLYDFILHASRSDILGLILGLRPANERRRYFVTTSLIGWAQT